MLLRTHRLVLFLFLIVLSLHFLVPPSESQGTNQSVLLNGTSSYVDVPYNANLNITGALTMEAWVKTSATTYQMVLERGDWFQNQMSYDLAIAEGKVRMDIMQTSGSYVSCIGATVMSSGAWHHIAGVYDGSQMRVYLDGVLDGSAMATMTPGNNTTGLRIGKSSFLYNPNYLNGRIDEVRVSNAALYSSNFTPSAHLGATSSTKGLWKFDGQTANDSSGSGAHGSLQGSAQYSTDVPTGPNNAPTIALNDPLNNTNFAAGSNVVIDASASDSDGYVAKVEFFQGATLLGTDLTAPYTYVWSNVAAGSYAISARATDDLGTTTTTTPITITVNQAGGDRSILFNGTSSYVDVPYNANLNITGALTMEAWVKTSATTYQMVLERGDWFQNQMSYDLAIAEGKVRMDIMQSNGSYVACIGSTSMNNGAWHHVAGVYDGSQMRVYLDGVLNGSATATMTPGNNTTGLRIGKSSFLYFPNYFNGRIDEVRVSNAALYSGTFTPAVHLGATSNTKGLWKFDGETTNDASASGASGTLQGGATYSTDVPTSGGGAQVPIAVAGGPYSAQLGQAATFNSSGSFDPDGTISSYHWNFGDGASANTSNPSHTYQTSGLFTATLTVTDNSGLRASATATVTINGASEARLDPRNQTGGGGENALSQNYNWNLPLLSLPGRAGMNLGLALSYNSLVWTKNSNGNYVTFDDDHGFPSPGFRLGFPVIQPMYHNSEVGKDAFLMIGTDGSRTELRRVSTSALFEAADSSHLLLDTTTMTVVASDGTKLSYVWMNSEYNCTQIKDRNGNYITINYTPFGRIDTVVDTLARSIKLNYDVNGLLASITQVWNQGSANQVTHNWAVFTYADTFIQTNFTGLAVYGVANNSNVKTLARVTLADGSHSDFSYTNWGQVWKVSNSAPNNDLLSYRAYNLPGSPLLATGPQSDCPRFTQRRDWAKYWNGDTNGDPGATPSSEDAVTSFVAPADDQWTMPDATAATGKRVEVTSPDGTLNKIYFIGTTGDSSAWRRSLPALVVTYSGGVWQRKVMTTWTQDDTGVVYPLNPRVTETNIYDPEGNRARTRIVYQHHDLPNGTSCELPKDVFEYAANATTVLRSTRTLYNMGTVYTNRHILGLASDKLLYDGDVDSGGTLMSKFAYFYDETGSITGSDAPVQHDDAIYNSAFVAGRGNLSSVRRYDVTNTNVFTATSTKYNAAGSLVSSTDAASHTVSIGYVDAFSDGTPRNTLAYPTMVTDPDNFSSTSKYNFDFGAVTRTQSPQPNTTTPNLDGPEQSWTFDSIGRLQQVTNLVNNAYTRFEYDTGQLRVDTYATIQEGLGEAHSFSFTDGAGRVIAKATDHPGSTGGFSGNKLAYDVMGRVIKTSNPTETNASGSPSQWITTGDDQNAGWKYTEQTYDWKGRRLITTNQDLSSKSASYAGCGCAGGEVVTLTDEVGRRQKIYSDVIGRDVKSEVLNSDGSTYATTVKTYNVRDQVILIRQYQGDTNSSVYQDTAMSYDGYGRLSSQHDPEQATGYNTTFTYNADDVLASSSDARGATTTYSYNSRHLITGINYSAPSGILVPGSVSFSYDGARNRTAMTDGLGSASYQYDQLSRLVYESRRLNDLPAAPVPNNAYTISYTYNLAGALQSITDPFGKQVTYTRDAIGRLTSLSRPGFGGEPETMSNIQYRAWGKPKQVMLTGNNQVTAVSYNHDTRLAVSRFQVTPQNGGATLGAQYTRNADGQIGYAQDLADPQFDRAYAYDQQMGRVTQGLSGAEARGAGTVDGPYKQTYGYDAFSNITSRTGRLWTQNSTSQSFSFVNNRSTQSGWQYDLDGRATQSGTQTFRYDAAGRQINSSGMVVEFYDGDGKRLKDATNNPVTYEIRSSVLGGQIVSYLFANGQHGGGIVYADGNPVGRAQYDANSPLGWELHSPINSGMIRVLMGAIVERESEFSPIGDGVGTENPFLSGGSGSGLGYPSGGGDPSAMRCAFDGMEADCQSVYKFAVRRNFYQLIAYIYRKRFTGTVTSNRAILVPGGDKGGNVVYGTAGPNGLPSQVEIIGEPDQFQILSGTDVAQSFAFLQVDLRLRLAPQKTEKDGVPEAPLSHCLQWLLAPYFKGAGDFRGLDLSEIRVHEGLPEKGIAGLIVKGAVIDVGAITLMNDIYFAPGQYAGNLNGIELVAHELTHVKQFYLRGQIGFAAEYLGEFRKNKKAGMSDKDAYANISFEREAAEYAANIKKAIRNQYGEEPCAKFKP